jgi:23S rRNA (uridine2552-2'-O)-methyltransferase
MPRSKSSRRWLERQQSDPYVKLALREGYRSRAVYKLQEIDQRDHLFRSGMSVVDLGAAPGGWSQYARERVGPQGWVLALDILPMEQLPGVEFIQGDFTENQVLDLLMARLAGRAVDLVISDMAPNISGVAVTDQARASGLAELALDLTVRVLRPGGDLLVKAFQGEGFKTFRQKMVNGFDRIATRKPRASRPHSREIYLLGKGFKAD